MAILEFLLDAFRENTRCDIHPSITLNLKTDTRNSDYQFNEPPPKFIRSPFLYITYIPPGHILQPLPWGLWGVCVILKNIISWPFNYVEQNGYLNISIGLLGEILGVGGGFVALQTLPTIKKDTNPFSFQSNEPFSKFLLQQIAILKFLSDIFQEKYEVWGGRYLPFHHSES